MYRVPIATYRVQFNSGFTFEDARRIVPYLAELGLSDLYSSPVLRARKGSTHGYDVVDAASLNPELGTEEEFRALHEELRKHKLGFLLDIVPNHMAASQENAWWMSVLENGPQSRYLHYFDIDWKSVPTRGGTEEKVLLPILGKPYGEAVESGEIKLAFDAEGFYFGYYDKRLPLAPKSYGRVLRECVDSLPTEGVGMELRDLVKGEQTIANSRFLKETLWRIYEKSAAFRESLDAVIARFNGQPGQQETFNELDMLLDAQHYRLAYWRIASEKINYRRFFDVTDLVGVRIENPEVFEVRNRRILEMVADGRVTGLRIDHIDGLYDPAAYLRKLQLRVAGTTGEDEQPSSRSENHKSMYVALEKILAVEEELPSDFAASGTTGYDFLDSVNTLFLDPQGLQRLTGFYRSFTGIEESFSDICYERKKQVINELFSGEMRALGKKIGELSMHDRNARDFTPSELLAGLTEITASLEVYRTYIRSTEPAESDQRCIRAAVREARRRAGRSVDARVFQFLELVLLVQPPTYLQEEKERWAEFVMRWQQFTGRVMAKGVEDTSFYIYNRLVSMNEVGGEPGREGDFDPVEEFHRRNERMQRDWPHTMNATSTHDTKRSEDVRARLNVLSEIAESWARDVPKWSEMNAPLRRDGVPDRNTELLVYQTIIGMWPLEESELDTVPERLRQYLEKAAREAKSHTSWIVPDAQYEKALQDFATSILDNETFRGALLRTQRRTAYHGFLNALSQVVLKLTAPGAPDFYQGTEVWDLSLVDPDNRRPVDYESRRALLRKMRAAHEKGALDLTTLLRRWFDGRIKMFVTWRGLEARARHAEVFRDGGYGALRSDNPHLCVFTRGHSILVAVPRLTTRLVKPGTPPLGEVWGDAVLPGAPSGRWKNIFTGDALEISDEPLPLARLFERFPVAVLERAS